MLFYLARELGSTVADLERRMSAREFTEWAAYLSISKSDLAPPTVETDLMKVFGGPRG